MESTARKAYRKISAQKHENFVARMDCFCCKRLRADGLILCSCCDSGVLEIKCPFMLADKDRAAEPPKYITKDETIIIFHRCSCKCMFVMLSSVAFSYTPREVKFKLEYFTTHNTVKNLLMLAEHSSNTNLDHSISNSYTLPLPTVNDNAANYANWDSDHDCKIVVIPPNQTLSARPEDVLVARVLMPSLEPGVLKQHKTQNS